MKSKDRHFPLKHLNFNAQVVAFYLRWLLRFLFKTRVLS